jgi:hypothetical protein
MVGEDRNREDREDVQNKSCSSTTTSFVICNSDSCWVRIKGLNFRRVTLVISLSSTRRHHSSWGESFVVPSLSSFSKSRGVLTRDIAPKSPLLDSNITQPFLLSSHRPKFYIAFSTWCQV